VGGYFAPVGFYISIKPAQNYNRRDAQRGQIDESIPQGLCVAFPQLDHGDVIALSTSDTRYAVHATTVVEAVKNVPVIILAELRKLDMRDPVYDIALPTRPPLQTLDRAEL
jgi:hypothetical protein